jgi:GT2 family glycosyltransferase
LKYMRLSENYGFGRACNLGYKEASGDIIMFLNNDIRVSTGRGMGTWTDIYFEELNENPDALMGPTGGFIDAEKDFQFLYETDDPKKDFNYISGWMLVGTKKTFNRLTLKNCSGPFNEKFFAYYEDTDLSWRHHKMNCQLKLVPNHSVVHFGKITSRQLNTNQLYSEARQIFIKEWR